MLMDLLDKFDAVTVKADARITQMCIRDSQQSILMELLYISSNWGANSEMLLRVLGLSLIHI